YQSPATATPLVNSRTHDINPAAKGSRPNTREPVSIEKRWSGSMIGVAGGFDRTATVTVSFGPFATVFWNGLPDFFPVSYQNSRLGSLSTSRFLGRSR